MRKHRLLILSLLSCFFLGSCKLLEEVVEEVKQEKHVHDYSKCEHDETNHWYVCNSGDGARSSISAHTFSEGVVTREATCTEQGAKVYTCTHEDCGYQKTEFINPLGHSYDEGVVTTKPTCTDKGVKTFTCSRCGDSYTEEVVALGHSIESAWKVDSDNKHYQECSVCHEHFNVGEHTFGEGEVVVQPTHLVEGSEVVTCTVCHHSETHSIDTIPHNHDSYVVTKQPTLTKTGTALATCNECGANDIEVVVPELLDDETWTETVTQKPTCVATGLADFVSEFGKIEDVILPIDEDAHNVSKSTQYGYDYDTCSLCHKSWRYEDVSYKHEFNKTEFSLEGGEAVLDDINWEYSEFTAANMDTSNGKGFQIGTSSKPTANWVISSSDFSDVSKIVINASTAKDADVTMKVMIGKTVVKEQKLAMEATDYTINVADTVENGELLISFVNNTSKAFYVKSIKVDYTSKTLVPSAKEIVKMAIDNAKGLFEEVYYQSFEMTLPERYYEAAYTWTVKDSEEEDVTFPIAQTTKDQVIDVKVIANSGEESSIVEFSFTLKGFIEATVAEALTIGDALEGSATSEELYKVTGFLTKVVSGSNTTYYLVDGDKKVQIYSKDGYSDFVEENANHSFKLTVMGNIQHYVSYDKTTEAIELVNYIEISHEDIGYAVTVKDGIEHGTVTLDKTTNYSYGSTVTITVTPDTDCMAKSVTVNGVQIFPVEEVYSFTVTEDAEVNAVIFQPTVKYDVTVVENVDCTIQDISGNYWEQSPLSFTVVAKEDSTINAVKINGEAIEGKDGKYSFVLEEDSTIVVLTEEKVVTNTYTVTFPMKDQVSISSYTSSFTGKVDDVEFTIKGFNNNKNGWSLIKCGSKNGATTASISATFPKAIATIKVVVDNYNSDLVTSSKLVLKDGATVKSSTDIELEVGENTITVPAANANYTYSIELGLAKGSSNGYVVISKLEYVEAKGEAHIHDYEFKEIVWDEDYSAVAVFECKNNSEHTRNIDCVVTHSTTTTATCVVAGVETYVATYTLNGTEYKDSKTKDLGKSSEHTYGEVEYVWSEDHSQCTATRICSLDNSHKETETVNSSPVVTQTQNCTRPELTKYTAEFTNKDFETQVAENIQTKAIRDHIFDWVVDTAATKTSTGTKHKECTYEDCKFVDQETVDTVIPMVTCDHEGLEHHDAVAVQCEIDGTKEYWYCDDCEKYYSDSACQNDVTASFSTWKVVAHEGHKYGNKVDAVAVACETDGVAAHYQCSVCKTYFDENKVATTLAALTTTHPGHSYGTLVPATTQSCTSDEVAAHYYCSACKTYFTEAKGATTLEALTSKKATGHKAYTYGYSKITSVDDLKEGLVVIFVYIDDLNTKAYFAGSIEGTNTFLSSISGTFSNNAFTPDDSSKTVLLLTLEKSGNSWKFKSSDGKYLGCDSDKKLYLGSGTDTWNISFAEDTKAIKIISTTSSNGTLMYNASSPRFKTYASGQKSIDLYSFRAHEVANNVPTSCSAAGSYDELTKCSVCNEAIEEYTKHITVPALPHTHGELSHDATGHWYNCTVCSNSKVDFVAHDTSKGWVVTTPVTCESDGEETWTCSVCSYTTTRIITNTSLGHSWSKVDAKSPWIDADGAHDGNIEYYKCSKCIVIAKDAQGTKFGSSETYVVKCNYGVGSVGYEDITEAISALTAESKTLTLYADATITALNKDIIIDLNGFDLTITYTVNSSKSIEIKGTSGDVSGTITMNGGTADLDALAITQIEDLAFAETISAKELKDVIGTDLLVPEYECIGTDGKLHAEHDYVQDANNESLYACSYCGDETYKISLLFNTYTNVYSLVTTSSTSTNTFTANGVSFEYCASKFISFTKDNVSSSYVFLGSKEKATTAFIRNTSPVNGVISSIIVYTTAGASGSAQYVVTTSSSPITTRSTNADFVGVNTTGYSATISEGAKYFEVASINTGYNGQIAMIEVLYTPVNMTPAERVTNALQEAKDLIKDEYTTSQTIALPAKDSTGEVDYIWKNGTEEITSIELVRGASVKNYNISVTAAYNTTSDSADISFSLTAVTTHTDLDVGAIKAIGNDLADNTVYEDIFEFNAAYTEYKSSSNTYKEFISVVDFSTYININQSETWLDDFVAGYVYKVSGQVEKNSGRVQMVNCTIENIGYAVELKVSNGKVTVGTVDYDKDTKFIATGTSLSFTVTPNTDYEVKSVKYGTDTVTASSGTYTVTLSATKVLTVEIDEKGAKGITASVSAADLKAQYGWTANTTFTSLDLVKSGNNVIISCDCTKGTVDPTFNNTSTDIRIYKNGGTMTIKAASGYQILSIKLTFSGKFSEITNNVVKTVNSTSIKLTCTDNAKITNFVIVYDLIS